MRTGREEEDITFYMSTVAKGLNPFNEEAKLKPGLYKDAHGPVKDLDPDNFDETIMDMSPDNNKDKPLSLPVGNNAIPATTKAINNGNKNKAVRPFRFGSPKTAV